MTSDVRHEEPPRPCPRSGRGGGRAAPTTRGAVDHLHCCYVASKSSQMATSSHNHSRLHAPISMPLSSHSAPHLGTH